jgi:hypothetical protein
MVQSRGFKPDGVQVRALLLQNTPSRRLQGFHRIARHFRSCGFRLHALTPRPPLPRLGEGEMPSPPGPLS